MAGPRRMHFERQPEQCPECGGHELHKARPDDLPDAPFDPEDAPEVVPGMLACSRCGTIVHWGR